MGIIQKILAGAVAVLIIAVGLLGWRLEAANQKIGAATEALQQAKKDNEAWTASEQRHEKYVEEVQAGFKAMQKKLDDTRQTNQTFQQQVRSNARSNDALDPNELGALRLWGRPDPADPSGAGQGGSAAKPQGVR